MFALIKAPRRGGGGGRSGGGTSFPSPRLFFHPRWQGAAVETSSRLVTIVAAFVSANLHHSCQVRSVAQDSNRFPRKREIVSVWWESGGEGRAACKWTHMQESCANLKMWGFRSSAPEDDVNHPTTMKRRQLMKSREGKLQKWWADGSDSVTTPVWSLAAIKQQRSCQLLEMKKKEERHQEPVRRPVCIELSGEVCAGEAEDWNKHNLNLAFVHYINEILNWSLGTDGQAN